jgi:hypothetical protein
VASLLDGFSATYDTIGRVMQDRDLREIARSKVGEQVGPVPDASMVADPEGAEPTKQYTYLGKTYDKAPDDAQQSKARMMAMAGVYDKYGDPERALRIRGAADAQAAAAEDRAHVQKIRPLQVASLERGERAAAKAESDATAAKALDADVGKWFEARLSGQDGSKREASIDDHLAAAQYRASKLVEAGRVDAAGEAIQKYQAGALAKIHMETAQRTDAAAQAAAQLANGNFDGVREFYNRFIPDGARVTDVQPTKGGGVVIKREAADGRPMPDQTMQDTGQLLAALNTFRDPMALYQWSQGEFDRNMRARADRRASAAEGRAAAAEGRAQEVHQAGAPGRAVAGQLATLQGTLLDPGATPDARQQAATALQGFKAATNPPKPTAAKVEGGDVTSLLGDPAVDRGGKPITDPMTGRQMVNRNPAREAEFFQFMRAAGINDTNQGLLVFKSLPEFQTEAALDAALKAGQVKAGEFVRVGGQIGKAQ